MNKTQRAPGSAPTPAETQSTNAAAGNAGGLIWTSTEDRLPPFGKYVLARHNRGTWRDSTDQANVNCVVVKRIKDKAEGNNLTPYSWSEFGPDHFFGQTITHWADIPALDARSAPAEKAGGQKP